MENPNEPRKPTPAQINANRENAKKSTGPRSAAGKAASSRNRFLHGLRANKHILLDEDPAEFLLLIHDHFDRFRPVDLDEENLVLRLAAGQWRPYRALPAEAGIYRDRFQNVADKDKARQERHALEMKWAADAGKPAPPPLIAPEDVDLLARAFNVDCEGANSFTKLARYEASIERSIDRCLRQLKTYQAARLASTPPMYCRGRRFRLPIPILPWLRSRFRLPTPQLPQTWKSRFRLPNPPQRLQRWNRPSALAVGAPSAEMPAATPSNELNYHTNPKNGGIHQAGAPYASAAILLLMHVLLSALPQLIAMICSLLTNSPARKWPSSVAGLLARRWKREVSAHLHPQRIHHPHPIIEDCGPRTG